MTLFTMPSGRPGTTVINGPFGGALPMMKHRYPVPRKEIRASRMMTVSGFRQAQVTNFWIAGELISPVPTYGPMAILKSRRRATGEDTFRGNLVGDYEAYSYILSLQINYTF